MVHELTATGAAPAVLRNSSIDRAALTQARIDLAASLRMTAWLGFAEGDMQPFLGAGPGAG